MNYKKLNNAINKTLITIFSIFLIIVLIWIVLYFVPGQDGNIVLKNIFYDWFLDENQILKIMSKFAPFLLGSLAVLICYKAGVINLAVAGQMSLSGLCVFYVGFQLKKILLEPGIFWLPILVLVAILVGIISSLFIAVLKIYFNINEVISGIFFNFIIMYLFKYFIKRNPSNDSLSTKESLGSMAEYNYVIVIIPITLIIVFFIYFFVSYILLKTRYGFELKMINKYKKSAKYAGIDYRTSIFKVFIVSGIFSGLSGLFYYFGSMTESKLYINEALPNNGFDTIIIVWLSQYSIVGLPFISFFIALLRTQTIVLPISHIDPKIYQIILGTILLIVPFFTQLFSNTEKKRKLNKLLIKFNKNSKGVIIKKWMKK